MTTAVWGLQWRLALTRKRVFILNVVVPLTLVLIVATGAVPNGAAAGVSVVLFAAFAVFGSALPLRWEGQRGISLRIVRGGVGPASYLLQRAAAGAVLDTLQLTPALWVMTTTAGATAGASLRALVVLAGTVWVCGLLGIVIAAASRSITETALFAAVTVPLIAHMSGVFHTPAAGTRSAFLESVSPLSALHESLLGAAARGPSGGLALLLWVLLLPALVWLLAANLQNALGRVIRGGLEGA
ncbi:MAG: hypothetical protein AB7T31_09275 [Gemmatimonadales bacterium]